jgi:L-seryl-tRNA(Ser) seleniumtransferase
MKRALRPDKITLVLLERLLARYEDPEQLAVHLPLLRTLTLPTATLTARAEHLAPRLRQALPDCQVTVLACESQVGSGSLPDQTLQSIGLRIAPPEPASADALLARLRALPTPVIGRIGQGAVWLDMRGAEPLDVLADTLGKLAEPL